MTPRSVICILKIEQIEQMLGDDNKKLARLQQRPELNKKKIEKTKTNIKKLRALQGEINDQQ